uniref:trypsin n=1 Tax=Xenopsylla cheopis TaxID=163159 RepID=A0A6M2DY62_XENCH
MFLSTIVLALVACALGFPGSKMPDGRIVGGQDTTIEEHPYQVSLLSGSFHNCGGSIIAKNWILTAAHCIKSTDYNVRMGSTIKGQGGVVIKSKKQYRHPDYNSGTIDYDFGLIELEESITAGNGAGIVKLADAGVELKPGTQLTVTGWGSTGSGPVTNILQEVFVPHVAQDVCEKSYPGELTDRMFCAGYLGEGGKDSCQGDSGGPVVVNGIQHGIVSWGQGCALPNYPGVYAKVPAGRQWIKEISGV